MIKVTCVDTPTPEQMLMAINEMRKSIKSWDKCDSYISESEFILGSRDYKLIKELLRQKDQKFMTMIPVRLEITAPLYWWDEFMIRVINSINDSSHNIEVKQPFVKRYKWKPFTLDDFVQEYSIDRQFLEPVIETLNTLRAVYIYSTDPNVSKLYYEEIVHLLPSSYKETRTVQADYAILKKLYNTTNSDLVEWKSFFYTLEGNLPYFDVLADIPTKEPLSSFEEGFFKK